MTDEKKQSTEMEVEAMDNVVTTSTGCRILCKQVPPWLYITALERLEAPELPKKFDKDFKVWMEGDVDNEAYQDKKFMYSLKQAKAMYDVWIVFGTELVEMPKDMEPHTKKNADWLKKMEFLGVPVFPDSDDWRYLAWVMTVAAPTADDMQLIQETVQGLSGVPEGDVADAEKFPGGK